MRFATIVMLVGCGGGTVGSGDGVIDQAPEIGWIAELEGTAHDVAGEVEIVDASTLVVRDFTYDGGGLNARFFLLVDGARFNRDHELTDNLVGTPFDGGELTLDLGDTSLEDFDLISLWCIPAGVSFGTGVFAPPE